MTGSAAPNRDLPPTGRDTPPSSQGITLAKRGLAGAFALLALLLFASLHEAQEGAQAMRASDAALAAKNPELAIAEAYQAAARVAPLSPWSERGFARLQAIAEDAEARGDDELAQTAWHAVRSAEVTTQGPLSGNPGRRRRAEVALGRIDARRMLVLAARSPGLAGLAREGESALGRAHGQDATPATGGLLLLGLGAVLSMTAAAVLVRSGFALRGRPELAAVGGLLLGALGVALALAR